MTRWKKRITLRVRQKETAQRKRKKEITPAIEKL